MKHLLFLLGIRTSNLIFAEALILLDQGKEVKRKHWHNHIEKSVIKLPDSFYEYIVEDNGIYKIPTDIAANDMFAEDWELVE